MDYRPQGAMAFWSTKDFKEKKAIILPRDYASISDECIRESSLELSLGEEVFISSQKSLKRLSKNDDTIRIKPGDFALLMTDEWVEIPKDCMAFISIRSKYKLSGLINISGFHVDPGFYGKLKFSVYNAGTAEVILRYKDPTFIIFIANVNEGAELKRGEHWGQIHIKPEEMMPLIGTGIPFHDLARRLGKVETMVKIYGGILVAIFILLLTRIL
jgi:dCTP deaminase